MNAEQIKESRKEYRLTHKKERKEYLKKYYKRPEAIILHRKRVKKYRNTIKGNLNIKKYGDKYMKEYMKLHKEEKKEYDNKYYEERRIEIRKKARLKSRLLKLEILTYYSGGQIRCECCNEKEIDFMTIDHIGGIRQKKLLGHNKNLGGSRFYRWLKNMKFPIGFRVLCINCNFAIGKLGYCPHYYNGGKK